MNPVKAKSIEFDQESGIVTICFSTPFEYETSYDIDSVNMKVRNANGGIRLTVSAFIFTSAFIFGFAYLEVIEEIIGYKTAIFLKEFVGKMNIQYLINSSDSKTVDARYALKMHLVDPQWRDYLKHECGYIPNYV